MKCPFCAAQVTVVHFAGHENLVGHVLHVHPESGLSMGHFPVGGECVVCWCGEKLYPPTAVLHFLEKGGMGQHFLEWSLLDGGGRTKGNFKFLRVD